MRYSKPAVGFRRGLTWATVPTERGELLIITTHLSACLECAEERASQVQELLEFWKGRPRTVIAGDLNATPEEEAVRALVDNGFVDSPTSTMQGLVPTYPSQRPRKRIDYILFTRDVSSLETGVLRSTASDHLPVCAQVEVQ
jgi:endonuclease/exonuclease/phosphatase family metal-dependent hydrolase